MKTLVFGGAGMLGRDLAACTSSRHPVLALSRQEGDITRGESIARALDQHQPDAVLIAGSWTDVDGAESHEAEARRVNVDGPRLVGEACAARNLSVLLVSTDYVFAGVGPEPHGEDDPHEPLNAYGRSKSDGEMALAASGAVWSVVRTSWLFGIHGTNFPATMMKLAATRDRLKVVEDQTGAPTYTAHLAPALLTCLDRGLTGSLHLAAQGQTTWFGLARELFNQAGSPVILEPCSSEEFPRPAQRPHWSVLGMDRTAAVGIVLPDWREGVRDWLAASAITSS